MDVWEEQYAALLQSALDAVVSVDHCGEITDFNGAAETTFGYSNREVIGKTLTELIIPPSLRAAHKDGFERYLATGHGPALNKRLRITAMRSDGTEFPVELTITPYRVGGAPRFTAYIRDLTEIVAAENARVSALDRAARHVSAALPADLEDGPVRITGFLRPLDRVGGDFYDFGTVAADTDQVYLYLGDVSGHDVAAALAAMSIHTILRTGASYVDAFGDWQGEIVRPDKVLDGLNKVFPIDNFEGEYFTIWFGVYQVSTRTLHFASAGHPPARTSSGDRLGSACPPVGMFEDTRYQIHRYMVPSGTHLFVASDGVASRLGNEFMDSFAGAQPTRHHTRKEHRRHLFDQLIVPAEDDASMLHVYFP